MPDMKTFKIRARKFVIDALTEANGYAPAPNVIENTVNRLVNTFKPLLKIETLSSLRTKVNLHPREKEEIS